MKVLFCPLSFSLNSEIANNGNFAFVLKGSYCIAILPNDSLRGPDLHYYWCMKVLVSPLFLPTLHFIKLEKCLPVVWLNVHSKNVLSDSCVLGSVFSDREDHSKSEAWVLLLWKFIVYMSEGQKVNRSQFTITLCMHLSWKQRGSCSNLLRFKA